MTREEYIEDIKTTLGAPVVELATESIIGNQVDKAFREISRFITETRFKTVSYSKGPIDTSDLGINSVIQLFRTSNPSRVADISDIYSLSTINTAGTSSVNLLLSDYLYRTQLNQLKSTMSTDLDFTFDKDEQKLYVATFYPIPQALTIVYIPEFRDVSEVTERYWVTLILRLALAFTKEAEGRVRSKYKLSSSLYTLDGDQLVSEGITERDAVRQELSDNNDIAFPMD